MPPKTHRSSQYLAERIREQRLALGMSIEQAAQEAGVGSKTWSRYESGQPIRSDKVRGVCKALKWAALPSEDADDGSGNPDAEWFFDLIDESHEAWSQALSDEWGRFMAMLFAAGSDLLIDQVTEDLNCLKKRPRGTHLGELPFSWLADQLPERYLMRYDYEFVHKLRTELVNYRLRARVGADMRVHTVADELLVNLIFEAAYSSCEIMGLTSGEHSEEIEEAGDLWLDCFCGDDDLHFFLYSDFINYELEEYKFENWFVPQFYLGSPAAAADR